MGIGIVMNNVYLVKSGMLKDFVGWEWLNLRVFTNMEDATKYALQVELTIDPRALGNTEDVEIETLTLE